MIALKKKITIGSCSFFVWLAANGALCWWKAVSSSHVETAPSSSSTPACCTTPTLHGTYTGAPCSAWLSENRHDTYECISSVKLPKGTFIKLQVYACANSSARLYFVKCEFIKHPSESKDDAYGKTKCSKNNFLAYESDRPFLSGIESFVLKRS